jgi:Domain of unknown function (DUF1772)
VYALALRKLTPQAIARVHSTLHPVTHRLMQPSTLLAAAAAVAIGAWDDPGWRASTIFAFAGLIGVAMQAILSRFWVVPMSDEMIEWEQTGGPADHQAFLRSWSILHGGRTVGAFISFFCYLMSFLLR